MSQNASARPSVLFLQGPPSAFARRLGASLKTRGAHVHRINLCFGDWLFWHDADAVNYRGTFADWEAYLSAFVQRHDITDIVYFADRFPYHRVARAVALAHGLRVVSYEYGYLRPDWIVVEPNGQSAYSHIPNTAEAIEDAARTITQDPPSGDKLYPYRFFDESLGDVAYHLGNYLAHVIFPRFQSDRYYHPIREYLSYAWRFGTAFLKREKAAGTVAALMDDPAPFFVVPLQMQNDYQLRDNAHYTHQSAFIEEVIASFAAHAPVDSRLLIKIHPLDNGLENWAGHARRSAEAHAVSDRVIYLDGGDLGALARRATGMVTINSTSGVQALEVHCPVKAMGIAVFDIPGLTHQASLDQFWNTPEKPKPGLVAAFLSVLGQKCHVRGNFYSREGQRAAADAFADRLCAGDFQDAFFAARPPRLTRAKRAGILVDAV